MRSEGGCLIKTELIKYFECYYLYLHLGLKKKNSGPKYKMRFNYIHSGNKYAWLLTSGFNENQGPLQCRPSAILFFLCATNLCHGTKIPSEMLKAKNGSGGIQN